jgi:hypothetical protein
MVSLILGNDQVYNVEPIQFSAGELQVRLFDVDLSTLESVSVEFRSSDDIITLGLVADTIKRARGSLDGIDLFIPYFPAARQDRVEGQESFGLKVYADIIKGTYYVGSGFNATKKKRNNMGIDKSFILHTRDWSSTYGYWQNTPTITDDLEKVCYILSGLSLPEKTAKMVMKDTKEETLGGPQEHNSAETREQTELFLYNSIRRYNEIH